MDCVSKYKYHCSVCCRIFKKFVIFEGHFEFFSRCRGSIGSYVECYVCKRNFHNLTALKYHLQSQQKNNFVLDETKERRNFNDIRIHSVDENISSALCVPQKTVGSDVYLKSISSYVLEKSSSRSSKLSLQGRRIERPINRCRLCKANFTTHKRHKRTHFFGTIPCNICKILFTSHGLTQHQKVAHNSKRIQKIYKCNICKRSFTAKNYLKLHMKAHLKFKDDGTSLRSYECYLCKKVLPAFDDVTGHMDKHVIYEQWTDPASIVLSNWSPENFQEILQNQPLVLVENLKIDRINLASLNDFIHRNESSSELYEKGLGGPTVTFHSESFVGNIPAYWKILKLDQLDDCGGGEKVNDSVSNEHPTLLYCTNPNTVADVTQDDHLKLIVNVQEAADSSDVVGVTETVANNKDVAGNVIDIIDLSSDIEDDDVMFVPETIFSLN